MVVRHHHTKVMRSFLVGFWQGAAPSEWRKRSVTVGQSEKRPTPRNIRHGVSRWLSLLAARFRAWLERRRVARELSQLSDRDLDDIGLSRWQIQAWAAGRLTLSDLESQRTSGKETIATLRPPTVLGECESENSRSTDSPKRRSAA